MIYCFQPPSKAGLGFHSPCFTKMAIKVIFLPPTGSNPAVLHSGETPVDFIGGLAKLG